MFSIIVLLLTFVLIGSIVSIIDVDICIIINAMTSISSRQYLSS